MKSLKEVTEEIKTMRDALMLDYDIVVKRHEKNVQSIKNDFVQHTPRFSEEMGKEKKRFMKELDDSRNGAKASILKELSKLRDDCLAEVTDAVINDKELAQIRQATLNGVSKVEFDCLMKKFGNSGYFTRKLLADIAKENAIDSPVEPTVDKKIEILSALASNYNVFISSYEGRGSHLFAEIYAGVTNELLSRAVTEYETGAMDNKINDNQAVERIISMINAEETAFMQAKRIETALSNSNTNVKNGLIVKLALNNKLHDVCVLAGIEDSITNVLKNNGVKRYREAGINVEKLMEYENVDLLAEELTRISKDRNRKYEKDMINSYLHTNPKLRNAGAIVNAKACQDLYALTDEEAHQAFIDIGMDGH